MPATDAGAGRAGDVLRFSGPLLRARVAALWRALPDVAGVRTIDLAGVPQIDSAGLALLAEVAQRSGAAPVLAFAPGGAPDGLDALRAAYRLDAGLRFQAA